MLATVARNLGCGSSIMAATVMPVRGPCSATILYNVTICQEFLSGPSHCSAPTPGDGQNPQGSAATIQGLGKS